MRFRTPTAPDPMIIQSLIALFDAIHSALHSLKNAVMVLPVMDSQDNEDIEAELSYCFSVENVEAVRAYGRSVQSLLKQLAGQQSQVESAMTNFPPALSEQLNLTIASLLQQGPEVAERIDRFGLHAKRFTTLDAATPEEREAFLPYAKAHLDALYGLLADEEEGLLHRVSAALEPFEVGSILSAAARPVRARAQALGIQVEIPAVSKRLRLQSNPQPLTEVLDGLLSNALDAVMAQTKTRAAVNSGEIRVAVQDGDGAIAIRIADNGCGLAPERLQSIRKGEHVTSKGKGRGNGFPSARQRLSPYHNASLDMESEGTGRGACAVVRLDLCKRTASDESVALRQRRALLVAAAMATVLIVAGLSGRLTNSTAPSRIAGRSLEEKELDRLYQQALDSWNERTRGGFKKAIRIFDQLINRDLDNKFGFKALGYSGKADSLALMSWHGEGRPEICFQEARHWADMAVETLPLRAEAITSRAWIYLDYDWNWPSAEEEFKRALTLNPTYETALHWHAISLATEGKFAKGIEELKKVKDPSAIISTNIAKFLRWDEKNNEALKQLEKTIDADPNFFRARLERGRVFEQERRWPEAIESFQFALDLSQSASLTLAALGHAYAISGNRPAALEKLEELKRRRKEFNRLGQGTYASSYDIAVVCAGLYEKDKTLKSKEETLKWLHKAVEEKDSWLIYLNVEPMFKILRSDPGFKELWQKIHPEQ